MVQGNEEAKRFSDRMNSSSSLQSAEEFINPVDRQIAAMFQMSYSSNMINSKSNFDEKSFLVNNEKGSKSSDEDEDLEENDDEDDFYPNTDHDDTKSCSYANLKKKPSADTHSVDFSGSSIRAKTLESISNDF